MIVSLVSPNALGGTKGSVLYKIGWGPYGQPFPKVGCRIQAMSEIIFGKGAHEVGCPCAQSTKCAQILAIPDAPLASSTRRVH